MTDNKRIMAENLKYYMEKNNVNSTDVCKALHISNSTFSDWTTGKAYPRIDKIELLAYFFGINKADLVEKNNWQHTTITLELPKSMNNDTVTIDMIRKNTLYDRYKNASPETQEIIKRLLLLKEGEV